MKRTDAHNHASGARAIVGVLIFCASVATADANVVLRLTDGSRVEADSIAPESTEIEAVLISRSVRIHLSRKLSWSRVEWAEINGERFSRETCVTYFANRRNRMVSATTPFAEHVPEQLPLPPDSVPIDCAPPYVLNAVVLGERRDPLEAYRTLLQEHFPDGIPLNEVPYVLDMLRAGKFEQIIRSVCDPTIVPPAPQNASPPIVPNARLQSISVTAAPVSSRGTLDWDALEVQVAGTDRDGQPVPVRGIIRVTLWGQQQQLLPFLPEQFAVDLQQVKRVAEWTRQLTARDDRLVLPLPHPLPEHDLRLSPLGEVHVQLLAPGEGVFEAAEPAVFLRHESPIRDRQFLENGTLFFAGERTQGSLRRGPLRTRQLSTVGPNRRVFSVQP